MSNKTKQTVEEVVRYGLRNFDHRTESMTMESFLIQRFSDREREKDNLIEDLKEALDSARGWVVSYQMQHYSKAAGEEIHKIDEILGKDHL